MRLHLTLTICLSLSLWLGCAQASEFEELISEAPAVIPDLESDPLEWKHRSDAVKQILAPSHPDFEKVGYRIGTLDALTESLNSPNARLESPASLIPARDPESGFGSETLNWSRASEETQAHPSASANEIEQLEYQSDPVRVEDPSLEGEIRTPDQIFDVPIDPLIREYKDLPIIEDELPKTLWREYADWFHSGFISWTERLELGGSFLEGNTNQEAFNTAAKFSRDSKFTSTQINIGGNHAQSKMQTTANRWFADNTTDFKREGNWLYFVRSLHEYDQFTNLDYRGTASFGTGYRFFNEENRKLIVRYGPGVTQEVFHSPRVVRTSPDLFAEVETKWLIGPRVVFEERATVHPNITNFGMLRVLNTTGFLIPLDDQKRWNLKVGFRYEYNGRPNVNRQPSDFATNVNIVYSRK